MANLLEGLLGGLFQQQQQPPQGGGMSMPPPTGAAPPAPPPPQYSPEVMRQAEALGADPATVDRIMAERRAAILGNVGASLLGAAQAGPIGQRGRMLAGLGEAANAGPNVTTSIMNSAQAKLYAESIKDRQSKRATEAEARKTVAGLAGLSPEERILANADPVAFLQNRVAVAQRDKDPYRMLQLESERAKLDDAKREREAREAFIASLPPEEQAIARASPTVYTREMLDKNAADKNEARLVKAGVPVDTAAKLAAGTIKPFTDPATGRTVMVDLSTGKVYGSPDKDGNGTPALPGLETTMPKGVYFEDAFGGKSVIGDIANKAAAPFGGQPAPDVNKTVDAMNTLKRRSTTDLASTVNGRPSNFLLQIFEGETLNPAGLWSGEKGAVQSLDRILREIDRGLQLEREQLDYVANRKERQETLRAIRQLEGLKVDYEYVKQNFYRPRAGAAPATGAAPGAAPGGPRIINKEPIR